MNTPSKPLAICALALCGALACGGTAASTPATEPSSQQRSSRAILTAEEILKTGQPNAYRAIQSARPQWLLSRPRGSSGGGYEVLQVYVEGNRYGTARSLEQITASSIKEIRYLDARDATTRYGTGHGAGAILITLVR